MATRELRRALAEEGRDFAWQWRAAIGLAVVGEDADRLAGLQALRALIGDDQGRLRRLVELVAARPAALEPASRPTGWTGVAPVDDPELLYSFAFGLDPGPGLVAR